MKFRIKKEYDGLYFAEYKGLFGWWYVSDSASFDIRKTREACKKFGTKKKDDVIENFEL